MINYTQVEGFFSKDQREFYTEMVKQLPDPCIVVEIGVYMGRSTIFLGQTLKESGKAFTYHAVDHFLGSVEHQEDLQKRKINLYEKFVCNIGNAGLIDDIIVHPEASHEAVELFADQYFDFIFIDASHDYENAKADIQLWLPKLKVGGMLAGDDWVKGWPGIQQAVKEILDYTTYGRVWKHVKTNQI